MMDSPFVTVYGEFVSFKSAAIVYVFKLKKSIATSSSPVYQNFFRLQKSALPNFAYVYFEK